MAARNIPETGENFAGYVPAKVQIAHVTAGSAATNDVVLSACGVYNIFTVTEPILIKHMWVSVPTAFTASVDLAIGDTASTSRFFVEGTIAATTASTVLIADTGTITLPYVQAAAVDINMLVDNATVAAGLINVYIEYAILAD